MIGTQAVGIGPVNDIGGAVNHDAVIIGRAGAESDPPDAERRRSVASFGMAGAIAPAMPTLRTVTAAASGKAQAKNAGARVNRGRVAEASGLFQARAPSSNWRRRMTMGAVVGRFRAVASAPVMLINAEYLVVAINAVAGAAGTVHAHVVRHAKASRAISGADGRIALSARRWAAGVGQAGAHATLATTRVTAAKGSGSAGAKAAKPETALMRIMAVAGRAGAVAASPAFNFIHYMRAAGRFAARAIADVVVWMYVHEPDYRTVFIRNDASTTRMQRFRKQPAEVLPYDMDFAEWLAPLIGDDIESAQVYVSGAINGDIDDLTIDRVTLLAKDIYGQQTIRASRAKVWLSGGVDGATYKVTVRVDTAGGRRKEVDFQLIVREV